MSELTSGRRRRQRSEARRSAAAILDAAVETLGTRPEASIEEIATAAGLTRQTVYAHYPSREALVAAVVERVTADAVAAMDAADLEGGSATDALLRWVDVGWRTLRRYPLLLRVIHADHAHAEPGPHDRHRPILDRLQRLVARGRTEGEFDAELPPEWLAVAIVAVAHCAAEEHGATRMSADEAEAALRRTILRLVGAT